MPVVVNGGQPVPAVVHGGESVPVPAVVNHGQSVPVTAVVHRGGQSVPVPVVINGYSMCLCMLLYMLFLQ